MNRNKTFWFGLAAFQVAFGCAVFFITRDIYQVDQPPGSRSVVTSEIAGSDWAELQDAISTSALGDQSVFEEVANDPAEIYRLADEHFSRQQYAKAAELYERVMDFDPQNVVLHNNLGLTLHYLGRSEEALTWLNDGVAIDPDNQRIWLTLGFVASSTGDTTTARQALGNAVQKGSDESIRQSAQRMLDALP